VTGRDHDRDDRDSRWSCRSLLMAQNIWPKGTDRKMALRLKSND